MKIHCININCILSIEVDIDVQIFEIDILDIFIEWRVLRSNWWQKCFLILLWVNSNFKFAKKDVFCGNPYVLEWFQGHQNLYLNLLFYKPWLILYSTYEKSISLSWILCHWTWIRFLGINTLCINVTYFKKIQKLSSLKIEYFSYVRVSINSKHNTLRCGM